MKCLNCDGKKVYCTACRTNRHGSECVSCGGTGEVPDPPDVLAGPPMNFAAALGMPPGSFVAESPAPAVTTEHWGVVELMGYRLYQGRVSEVQFLGTTMGKVEVPRGKAEADGYTVVFFRGESVYAITLSSEAAVRAGLFPESSGPADEPPFHTLPYAAINPPKNPGYYESDIDDDDSDLEVDPDHTPL